MKTKSHQFEAQMMAIIGAVILVVAFATVVMPTVFAPTQPSLAEPYTNDTAIVNVNESQEFASTYTVTNIDTGVDASLSVSFVSNATGNCTVLNSAGTKISNFSGTTPFLVTIPHASLAEDTVTLYFNTTDPYTECNISASTLTYSELSQSSDWDTGTATIWPLLGIALAGVLILAIFTMLVPGRRR